MEETKKQNLGKQLVIDIIESFVSSFVVLIVLYLFLAFPEVVSGASMEPYLHDGERILVEKITYRFQEPQRGDVIIFHPPENDNIDYVKRVIGVPGDVIKISDCRVYITRDGERFEASEPYLYEDTCTRGGIGFSDGRATRISEGEYLVLGDNRGNSADSRVFGLITTERIVGKAIFRFWPLSKVEFL